MKQKLNESVKTSLVGLFVNGALAVGKISTGWLANSQSLVADGVNSLSDALSAIISVVSFLYSSRPADSQHPYGHERMEYLGGIAITLVMGYLGYDLLVQSVLRITSPTMMNVEVLTLAVISVSIATKLWLAYYYHHQAIVTKSSILKTNSKDSLYDSLMSATVLVSLLLSKVFGIMVDGYLSIGLSLMIIKSAFGMLRDFVNQLLGKRPEEEILDIIKEALHKDERVIGYHDLLIHLYGKEHKFGSVDVELNQDMSLQEAHNILDAIELEIESKTGITMSLHLDPVDIHSEQLRQLKRLVDNFLAMNYPDATFHDLRKVGEKRYRFDLVSALVKDKAMIEKQVDDYVANHGIDVTFEVFLDVNQLI